MPAVSLMPMNVVTSSYAEIASVRKVKESVETRTSHSSSIMDSSEDASGKEEPNAPDNSSNGITSSGKKTEPKQSGTTETLSPSQSSSNYPQVIPPHGTPQQYNYYGSYNNNSQVTPDPPSPNNLLN